MIAGTHVRPGRSHNVVAPGRKPDPPTLTPSATTISAGSPRAGWPRAGVPHAGPLAAVPVQPAGDGGGVAGSGCGRLSG
ncbi:hypothetical protein SAMN04488563_0733 [Jiangella alkaliphila]|uniref:Uncharacterized protein n=1 Tax=Jiangella alkaliphila TaxID=419479 RepID=A0A1H2GXL4_9ACTN|nr:hypothetical protein SAMN04488563_0733 [Jiangella alkaliphila]